MTDDPWSKMREASVARDAPGKFSESKPLIDELTLFQLIKVFFKVEIPAWIKRQFPLASAVDDSEEFLALMFKERTLRGRVVSPARRVPLVFAGRRISAIGVALALLLALLLAAALRSVG